MSRDDIDQLLQVQERDTSLDRIRHQIEVLPARAERDAAQGALEALDASIAAQQAERDELARRQKRLDDEVETLGAKRTAHDTKLYGGTVTNARELQDLQEEIESLGRRITHLEDDELEIMELVEPIEAALVDLRSAREKQAIALDEATVRLAAEEADLAGQLATEQAARDEVAAGVTATLLTEYDQLRAGGGGVGIARLVGNQCGGCHLTLSAMEVATIRKHPDEVTHCEECGRLLVP